MRKLKAVMLGCGERSTRYAEYSLKKPEELEIIASIYINPFKL